MKKRALLVLVALVAIGTAGEMFLVEKSFEGDVECPLTEQKLLEIVFTLNHPAYVTFVYGGITSQARGWLKIDGTKERFSVYALQAKSSFYYEFEDTGEHRIEFWRAQGVDCRDPLLQALVFLQVPDSNSYVSERPSEEDEVQVSSVLTVGPMVRVPGCRAVVDATGRTVDCVIEGDQVLVDSLPIGTYFATGSNGRTTKIVKLK